RARARVQQEEAARPVRVLRHARLDAALAEERRLLIAGDAGDRDRRAEHVGRRLAERAARGQDGREDVRGHVEEAEERRIPGLRVDVEEERARRVGGIGRVPPAAGELPEEPGVDRAEAELAGRRPLARAADVVEHPADLRAGEVRVEDEPGLRAYAVLVTVG